MGFAVFSAAFTPSVFANPNTAWLSSLGSSGGNSGLAPGEHFVTIGGRPARIYVGDGYNPSTPTFLAWYLHGDEGGYDYTAMDAFIDTMDWVLVAPRAPQGIVNPTTYQWDASDGGSQSSNLAQIQGVLDHMITNYNVYTNFHFGAGASGGSWFYDLYASSLSDYPTYFNLNCGAVGLSSVAPPASATYVANSELHYTIGTDDFLFGGARESAPTYEAAGYQVGTDFLIDVSHCGYNTGASTVAYWQRTFDRLSGCCTFAIYDRNPIYPSYAPSSQNHILDVQTLPGCTWTASTSVAWILLNNLTGTGPGQIQYTLQPNTTGASRNGQISVEGDVLDVRQDPSDDNYETNNLFSTAADLKSNNGNWLSAINGPGVACDRDRYKIEAVAGELEIKLFLQHSHAAGNLNLFLYNSSTSQVINATSTTDNEILSFTAAAPGDMFISVSGASACQPYDLWWDHCPAGCTSVLSSSASTLPASGGTSNVIVTIPAGCAWSVAAPTWVTITSGTSGTGSGSVVYSLPANNTGASRTANLIIGGELHAVTQPALPACSYTLAPATVSIPDAGGTGSATMTVPAGCAWTATAPSWVTITSGATGTGNGTISYTVAANPGTASRTGTLSVGGESHVITQAAPSACTYTLSPAVLNIGAGGGWFPFEMVTGPGCAWAWAGPYYPWVGLRQDTGTGLTTNSIITLWNSSSQPRTAVITIQGQQLTVIQAGAPCVLSMSTNMSTYAAAGSAGSFTVSAPADCNNWTPATSDSWINITSGSITNFGSVNFIVAANSGPARTGSITIGTQTHTITQAAFLATPLPDLKLTPFLISSFTTNSIAFTGLIVNVGNAPATLTGTSHSNLLDNISWQTFRVASVGTPAAGGAVIAFAMDVTLNPGDSYPISLTRNTSSWSGTNYFLQFHIDWSNNVPESDEANNIVNIPLPQCLEITSIGGGGISVESIGVQGVNYYLEETTDLVSGTWTPSAGLSPQAVPANGDAIQFTTTPGASHKIYRIVGDN